MDVWNDRKSINREIGRYVEIHRDRNMRWRKVIDKHDNGKSCYTCCYAVPQIKGHLFIAETIEFRHTF